jgi:alpha-1,2-mannosyltransferase
MIDLAVYRAGGHALATGQPLYSAHPDASLLPFTYPPFAGLLCVPLAGLPWDLARLVMTLLSVAALVAVVRATVRVHPAVVVAAALALEPVRATLEFGQVNLLVMALVVLDLTRRSERASCGVLIGLAAAVKLTPLIFIAYLLVTGRRRAAGTALATFGGTVLLGWVLLPAESTRYWFHLVAEPDRVGGVAYSGNQSLLGALTRLLDGSALARSLWLVTAAVVGVLGLAAAAALAAAGRELAGIALCGLTGLLVSPISWTHHWVWVLPAGIAAAAWRPARPALALGGLLFGLAPVWWPAHGGDREYGHSVPALLAADAYVLAGLAVLLAAAAWTLGPPAGSRLRTAGSPPRSAS